MVENEVKELLGANKITAHNRVALPPEVLEALGLEQGDYVVFGKTENGEV